MLVGVSGMRKKQVGMNEEKSHWSLRVLILGSLFEDGNFRVLSIVEFEFA